MEQEQRRCQNCAREFIVESEDQAFYAQMQVPPPTWCPECRRLRRIGWTGYRVLYKRKCDYSGEDVITFYHPQAPYKVWKQDIWWSDVMDAQQYGRDYDFNRNFFEQFDELLKTVPLPALHTEYTKLVNSDYCNGVGSLKNSYLVFQSGAGAAQRGHENTAYMHFVDDSKDSMDVAFSSELELAYECVRCIKCYRTLYSVSCEECQDVSFCEDCTGCSDCLGCVGLRKKQYCIFNQQYTKEEYERKVKEYNLTSRENVGKFKEEFRKFSLTIPRKNFHGRRNVNTLGDYISNAKNVRDSYMVQNAENIRYSQIVNGPAANIQDNTLFGVNAEWVYESSWVGLNINSLKFSFWNYSSHHLEYSFGCHGSENLFGCVGIRKGSYCIFNKPYEKEEYFKKVEEIKAQMNEKPYIDVKGRTYKYGEFFPPELSPWAFNESMAWLGLLPLSREEALAQGFTWREDEGRTYRASTAEIPDDIKDVPDSFSQEILQCEQCGKNYQIIKMELDFYRRMGIPLPIRCPLCREKNRTATLNPMDVYDRTCAKCGKEIQASYAPERPEIVYCEQCYQAEVA